IPQCADIKESGQPNDKCRCNGITCTVGKCKIGRGDDNDKCT
uniref:Ornatin-A3 n=1 Tax=Placobdella ornata TaxID=6415 RepID=ORN3_PLAOR|nr:RecName: Full=Ornatin-A3 [Placobdella ornata]AAB20871.1 ornatin A3 [Placobdella ornata=turtle leech, Peptide, 41 aa] [Placobdella ornata]